MKKMKAKKLSKRANKRNFRLARKVHKKNLTKKGSHGGIML